MTHPTFFVTGTDTDVGKTVAAAWLTLHLDGVYWKPLQCGDLENGGDTQAVRTLAELPDSQILTPRHELAAPLSPHEAARRENTTIQLTDFTLPKAGERPLILEGAGGLLVPLNDTGESVADLIQHLDIPAIVVTRSTLGTINHTLLTLEALRQRQIPVAGLIMNGPLTLHNRQALEQFSKAPILAEIPTLDPLTKEALLAIKPEIDPLKIDLEHLKALQQAA